MSKSILIIGAGPGIGQAAAKKFGRGGWTVVLSSRNVEHLTILVAELKGEGISAHAIPTDATDPASLRTAVAEASRLAGGLSALLYNAAVVRQQDLFSMTDAEVASDLTVNVMGGLHAIRAGVAEFGNRGGTMLVTGGGLALQPHAEWASLGVGKAGLRNLVQGLAAPLAERGIRIAIATVATLISPGSTEADGVAETLWQLAHDPATGWEAIYPSVASKGRTEDGSADGTELTLVARLKAKPEHAEALGEGLRLLIQPTLAEEGAVEYRLHRDNDDPALWLLYETWRSRADLEAHFERPYTKALMARFPELLAEEMDLTFATAVPA
jgi:NAD(P)-dependent dehydrogenase (short-subunit alcohol dehydrogenase family)